MKALLLIDRGSREPGVKQELKKICSIAKYKTGYDYATYCFLEVVPPFIEEGIKRCLDNGADFISVMPYFLYPGMKLKDSVKRSAKICYIQDLRMAITKPLSYHSTLKEVLKDRITQLKIENQIQYSDAECDIVVIGHGSSDKNARTAFDHTIKSLIPHYRNVHSCFLELDKPNIEEGIKKSLKHNPKILLLAPYFLHEGAHIKYDIVREVKEALHKYHFKNAYLGRHLGINEKLINIVVERVKEVEKRIAKL
jgi:sirohydrochlorin ferrochelatase